MFAGSGAPSTPLGYLAVAPLDAIGLPAVDAALALNVALVGVPAALTALAAPHRAVALVAAIGVVLVSRPLWATKQSTMPDIALTAVVAAALAPRARPTLTALTIAAAALNLSASACSSVPRPRPSRF